MTPVAGHVALVGLSGTGKSTVAPLLAARRGLAVVDLDRAVAESAGRTVAEIFATDGEAAFRSMESAALADALAGPPAVVATGGGVVLDPANRAALAEHATVVWLRASPVALVERLDSSTEERPLLAGGTGAAVDRLALMASERGPLYESVADVALSVEGRTAADVVEAVDELLDDLFGVAPTEGAVQ